MDPVDAELSAWAAVSADALLLMVVADNGRAGPYCFGGLVALSVARRQLLMGQQAVLLSPT